MLLVYTVSNAFLIYTDTSQSEYFYLIGGKDNARRVQQQDGKTKFYQTWYCRAEACLMQR